MTPSTSPSVSIVYGVRRPSTPLSTSCARTHFRPRDGEIVRAPALRAGLQLGRGGAEDLRAVAVQRRINPFCVDDVLGGRGPGPPPPPPPDPSPRYTAHPPARGRERLRTKESEAEASAHPVDR